MSTDGSWPRIVQRCAVCGAEAPEAVDVWLESGLGNTCRWTCPGACEEAVVAMVAAEFYGAKRIPRPLSPLEKAELEERTARVAEYEALAERALDDD